MSEYEGKYDLPDGINDGVHDDSKAVDPGLTLSVASGSDRAWMSIRRFAKISIEAGLATFLMTGDWMKSAGAGLLAGATAGGFKLVKENKKAKGKKPAFENMMRQFWKLIVMIWEYLIERRKEVK